MSPFFIVPILILLGIFVFFHRRLAVATGLPRAWQWVVAATLLVLFALVFVEFLPILDVLSPAAARPFAWIGSTWMGAWIYLLMGLTLTSLVAALIRILGRGDTAAARLRWNRLATPVAVLAALAVTGYGVARAADPRVTPMTFRSAALPTELEGTKVALVTDIHAGAVRSADFTRKVVDRVNAAEPDIIVLGGDLIDGEQERFGPEIAPLRDLRAPLGVYAVTGNHEMFNSSTTQWVDQWSEMGLTVLRNQWTSIERDGASLTIAGVDDWVGTGDFAPDVPAALDGAPADDFLLFVAHQPRHANQVQGKGVDLQVSGHTHGGQLWPGRYFVPMQQPAVDGLTRVGDVPVITSRGAGAWGPPVRVGADPQIPVITLERG